MSGINSAPELEQLVLKYRFLPFFECPVPGLSVEEHTPPERWFSDTLDGPWDWKGAVARGGKCAYGKFFAGRAGFISLDCLPDFINYRRDGYDFDARWEDGLASIREKTVYDAIAKLGPVATRELRAACGLARGQSGGFEGTLARLQTEGYILISDFVRPRNRFGQEYGWATAVYATPEQIFGAEFVQAAYSKKPADSFEAICRELYAAAPGADRQKLCELLKI